MVDVMERNFIEITKADLQRMRGSPPNDRRARILKEKASLKALSDERAQRWPNTIKALHEKRVQAKKEELEKLEHERLELDAREAKLKAEKRREMIERANKILLLPHMTGLLLKRQRENTDKEREAHIQYKKHIQEGWKRQEEKWFQLQKDQLEKWDKQEEQKLQKQKEQVKALANARLGQLQECQERLMEKRRKKEEEKAYLKRLEGEDLLLQEEKDKARQEEIKERNRDMIKGNEAQKAKKEEERQRLLKLDKEIEEFARKKEKMMDDRKKAEAMKVALKTQQREVISEKLYKQLLATIVDTERKLELEQNHKRDLDDERERLRIEKNKKSWEECDRSRRMQMKCKHEREMQDAADEKYEAEKLWECAWQCKMEFEAAERERFLKNKAFAEHHKKAMGVHRSKEIEDIEHDKEDERRALQRMEDEEMNGLTLDDVRL
ncbi:hypothetical protein GOP47_0007066 [Adiantum capillus-veneris]|uniref:Trichohyalin-plectin-homology domain-containing protein n=1 Tax=Adiantum capillus-veneris TaxID=13818 RepID=A0A9D4ZKJ5_ADICA|nr:hypothetical protein GOP47_0007066 [Adiantum capillus-veneris]